MKITISKNEGLSGGYWAHTHINGSSEIFVLGSKRSVNRKINTIASIYNLKRRNPKPSDIFMFGFDRHVPEIVYEEELKIPDEPVGNSHMASNHKEGKP